MNIKIALFVTLSFTFFKSYSQDLRKYIKRNWYGTIDSCQQFHNIDSLLLYSNDDYIFRKNMFFITFYYNERNNFSFSIISTKDNGVLRRPSPTREVWKIKNIKGQHVLIIKKEKTKERF